MVFAALDTTEAGFYTGPEAFFGQMGVTFALIFASRFLYQILNILKKFFIEIWEQLMEQQKLGLE